MLGAIRAFTHIKYSGIYHTTTENKHHRPALGYAPRDEVYSLSSSSYNKMTFCWASTRLAFSGETALILYEFRYRAYVFKYNDSV